MTMEKIRNPDLEFDVEFFTRSEHARPTSERLESFLDFHLSFRELTALTAKAISDDGKLDEHNFRQFVAASERTVQLHRIMDQIVQYVAASLERGDKTVPRARLENENVPVEDRYIYAYNQVPDRLVLVKPTDIQELSVSVCDIQKIVALQKKYGNDQVQPLLELWQMKVKELESRWSHLTGSPLGILKKDLVPIDTLTSKLISLATRPGWSLGLADEEDRYYTKGLMQYRGTRSTRPLRQNGKSLPLGDNAAAKAAGSGRSGDEITSERPDINTRDTDVTDADDGAENQSLSSAAGSDCTVCNVNDIMEAARANIASDPRDPNAGPNYTFPGPLKVREDIFYDYSIILPVSDCFIPPTDIQEYQRSLLAPTALANQAMSVLGSLKEMGLHLSLGTNAAGDAALFDMLEKIITDTINLDVTSSIPTIRDHKRTLVEMAVALEAIGRLKINLLQIAGIDPAANRSALDTALNNLNEAHIAQQTTNLPYNYSWEQPEACETLAVRQTGSGDFTKVPKTNSFYNYPYYHVSCWQQGTQRNDVRPYLKELGSWFYEGLVRLIQAARTVNENLRDFEQQGTASYPGNLHQYERYFGIQLNDIISNLAKLLRQIAEMISLPKTEEKDGNKRVGVQLVYRQRWLPTGYIRGKIVGHKSLAPNQEERVTRKTYIKTTTETQTLDEFVSSRSKESIQNTKETSELLTENSAKFGFSTTGSGQFRFAIGGFNFSATNSIDLSHSSRKAQTSIAEMTQKSSVNYNEKREIKVKDFVETYDETESINSIKNANQEITANYFYYQLLREYTVTVELADIRPVLLRSREIPSPASIDFDFVSKHAHILAKWLPAQLSEDMLSIVNEYDGMSRSYLRSQNSLDRLEAEWEIYKDGEVPDNTEVNPTARDDWYRRLDMLRERLDELRKAVVVDREAYLHAQTKMERVIYHLRNNRLHYMQYIWSETPQVDHDELLKDETIGTLSGSFSLPEVTRGLMRVGYYGNEEIFEYNGPAVRIAEILAEHAILGSDIARSMTEEELQETNLFRMFQQYYTSDEIDNTLELFRNSIFPVDPAPENTVLSTRKVQIAQDAVVVETMPGQVPLLEGYQMARRYLAVEADCLNNQHMRGRINDSTWTQGTDNHNVVHAQGANNTNIDVDV